MTDGIDLGKKAGPLPIGAWVVVVAGGLAIGWYFNRKSAQPNAVQTTESGTGLGGQGFETVLPPEDEPKPAETNEDWRKKVTNYLIGVGYPPDVADTAIRKYLTGQALNAQEKAAVNDVLLKFGVPPEPISGPPSEPPAAVTGLTGKANAPRSVTLNWLPSVGAKKYKVIVSSIYGSTTWETYGPPYTNVEIGANTLQTWTVIAVNDYGESDPRSVQVQTPPEGSGGSPQPQPQPQPNPAPAPQPRRYTIASGDTLWGISLRFYGTGASWMNIYNANAGALESAARAHGKSSSRGGPANQVGWWIFPGTVINIP